MMDRHEVHENESAMTSQKSLHDAGVERDNELEQKPEDHDSQTGKNYVVKATPLHDACKGGHLEIVQSLLSNGASVVEKDDSGCTPLHCACEGGHLEIVQLLLSSGARVDDQDLHDHWCPSIDLPSNEAAAETAELLLSKKAKVNTDNFALKPLHVACANGHLTIAQTLVEHGAGIDDLGPEGSPLHYACMGEHVDVINFLLSKGAQLEIFNPKGVTPLHLACEVGRLEAVNLLLSSGADVGKKDKWGRRRPLHIAVEMDNLEIVDTLLSHGARITYNEDGYLGEWNPFPSIIKAGKNELLKLLLSSKPASLVYYYRPYYRFAIHCGTPYKRTLMDLAIESGRCEIVQTLVAHNLRKFYERSSLRDATKSNELVRQLIINGVVDVDTIWRWGDRYDSVTTLLFDYALDSHEFEDWCKSFRVDERYLIKIKAAGLYGDVLFESIIGYYDHDHPEDEDREEINHDNFNSECDQEIKKMKNTTIGNTVATYHDLLYHNLSALTYQPIQGSFSVDECLKKFPIYGDMVICSYLKLRTFFLKDRSIAFFLLTDPQLLPDCAEQVIAHLDAKTMENLVNACWPTSERHETSLHFYTNSDYDSDGYLFDCYSSDSLIIGMMSGDIPIRRCRNLTFLTSKSVLAPRKTSLYKCSAQNPQVG